MQQHVNIPYYKIEKKRFVHVNRIIITIRFIQCQTVVYLQSNKNIYPVCLKRNTRVTRSPKTIWARRFICERVMDSLVG